MAGEQAETEIIERLPDAGPIRHPKTPTACLLCYHPRLRSRPIRRPGVAEWSATRESRQLATQAPIFTPPGGVFLEKAHMYAVIKTGGKQYKVVAGEKIMVEQIAADVGQEIVIDQVLAIGSGADLTVGSPLVAGASVKATVVAQGKHDKVHIFKMRRRKHYRKSQGHRQTYTELQISAVTA